MMSCLLPWRWFSSRRRIILLLLAAILVTTGYNSVRHTLDSTVNNLDIGGNVKMLEGLQKQQGQTCVHPKLSLWHEAIAPFFTDPEPLTCDKIEENWVYSVNGTFRVSESGKANHEDITCIFTPFIRGSDDFAVMFGEPIKHIKDGDPMPADFGEVKCVDKTGKVYKNYMCGIHASKETKERKTNFTGKNATKLNILMFGFDSVSRMTWMRNFPETHDYFTGHLGGVVMEGYNIVGDGTPQALLPILTGKTETELPEARRGFGGKPVDGHPWIWRDLRDLGYVTQWGEDGAAYGTFTYRMMGFTEQPVDHYMRPFYIRAEPKYGDHRPYCLGSLPRHQNMLNWVRDFYTVYSDQPKFSFVFHSEFSHNGFSKVKLVDKDLLSMLKFLELGGHLDNTLLILMADHGARFVDIRQTIQGKYEERMPYFSFRFPPKFQKAHPELMENLRINAQRLVTPFDVHATFEHLINLSGERKGKVTDRGISLLKEIPKERSCKDAEIEAHWCACLDWQNVDLKSPMVQKAAKAVLKLINGLTESERKLCTKLQIHNVTSAVSYSPNDKVLKFAKSTDMHGRTADLSDNMRMIDTLIQITLEIMPGGGRFEATVKYFLNDDKFVASSKEISRINKYGNQPHCVQKRLPHLRPYCYCEVQLQ